tara:strand:- start:121 stop:309 length:189 start_codon:yes stop_codon:yes gene_type:complete
MTLKQINAAFEAQNQVLRDRKAAVRGKSHHGLVTPDKRDLKPGKFRVKGEDNRTNTNLRCKQ